MLTSRPISLRQKLKLSPQDAIRLTEALALGDVGAKARDLFADIQAIGQQRDLLRQALAIDGSAAIQQAIEAFVQATTLQRRRGFGEARDLVQQARDELQAAVQIRRQRGAFALAGGDHVGDRGL